MDDSGGTARDIRNDLISVEWTTPRATQDTTGIDKSAFERLLLLADFSITLNGVFDPGSNLAHDVFKTVSSTDVARTTSITVSAKSLPNECFYTDYAVSRSDAGELTFSAPGILADGTVPTWA